jgi:hypothetical protein
MLTGAAAALLVLASPARGEDPARLPQLPAEAAAHRVMHEAMMRHASPPAHVPALPGHAGTQPGAGAADANAHRQAAEQMAQRHAAMDRDRRRDGTGDPAHPRHGGAAGTMDGGAGSQGEWGSCDGPAGHIQTMGGHGGPGGLGGHGDASGGPGGDHSDGDGMAPGSGPGTEPHAESGQMGGTR